MKILQGHFLGQKAFQAPVAVTIGNFDGFHLGHQHLVRQLLSLARGSRVKSLILNFWPHPQQVLSPKPNDWEYLSRKEDSWNQARKLGVDVWLLQEFNASFSSLYPRDFLTRYLFQSLNPKLVLLGYDFRFGKGGAGDFSMVQTVGKKRGCSVFRAEIFSQQGEVVSSTAIRRNLNQGRVDRATILLGRPYQIQGEVQPGQGMGRQLGFPTANLHGVKTLVPRDGVYVGYVNFPSSSKLHCFGSLEEGVPLGALLNIGVRPTLDSRGQRSIECHILNWRGEIYGHFLTFHFVEKLRDERNFSSPGELSHQIAIDVQMGEDILRRRGLCLK